MNKYEQYEDTDLIEPDDNDEEEPDNDLEENDEDVDITKDGPALKALAAAFLNNEIKCPNFHNGGECKPRCLTLDGRVGALDFKCSECTMGFSEVDKAMDWLAKCSGYPEGCFYYRKSQEGKQIKESAVNSMKNEIVVQGTEKIINERQEKALRLHKQIMANASIAARCLVEMGRDLKIVRDEKLYTEFGCESFDEYCETKAGIGERHGYNFIRAYERYGEEKLEQLSGLGIKKLLDLSRLDDEDIDELVSSGEAESLSTRKLNERIKELERKNEQLTLWLDEEKDKNQADIPLKTRVEDLQAMLDKANREKMELEARATELEQSDSKRLTELNDFMAASKDDKERIAAQHEAEVQELKEQIEKLKSKPAEVRELSEEEKAQIRTETETAIRQEIEEKADNERQAAVDEATKKVSEKYASEIERLKSENASLKSSSKPVAPDSGKERIKFFLAEIERAFNAMADAIEGMNTEEQEKYSKAAKTAIERMLNALGE